ncbi:hypothetical protein ABT218_37470 [Streptomyces sp. NPDC001455]|uniref:hypothetical protein n=1 Tax=Streptomyces sp. NPDC001455 TaxID=3154518 RepID=UPI00331B768C
MESTWRSSTLSRTPMMVLPPWVTAKTRHLPTAAPVPVLTPNAPGYAYSAGRGRPSRLLCDQLASVDAPPLMVEPGPGGLAHRERVLDGGPERASEVASFARGPDGTFAALVL